MKSINILIFLVLLFDSTLSNFVLLSGITEFQEVYKLKRIKIILYKQNLY